MRVRIALGVSAGAAAVVMVALLVHARRAHRESHRLREEAALEAEGRLNRYCDSVRDAFVQDAADLRAASSSRREGAADRFLEPFTFHSWDDVKLCTGGMPAIDKERCWLANDFECIAKQAEQVASMIPVSVASDAALLRLRERCTEVRWAMRQAARESRPEWPARPEMANRLGTNFQRLSKAEIELCAPMPPDLGQLDECRARKDDPCIERIAEEAARAIPLDDD